MQESINKKQNNNLKQRYEWLDIIKAICIITVVIFHIKYTSKISILNDAWNYLDKISDLYKVTIFYCVAGITLNNKKLKETFKFLFHKFKKLYLKAIIIGSMAVLLHNIFIKIGFYKIGISYSGKTMKSYNMTDYLINIIKTFLLANREVILGAFWFVYSLIICFILLSIIDLIINKLKFVKNKRVLRLIITFLLMFLSIFMTNVLNINIPRFSNSLVGVFLLDFTNYLFENKKFEKSDLYLVFICIICILLAPFFGKISMNTNTITNPFFLLIVVMASLYLLIFLSKKMENKKIFNFLKYIGKNSFSIMAFQFIGFKVGGILLNVCGYKNDISVLVPIADNVAILLYYLLFGVSISLFINYVLKKFFKFEL